MWNEPVLLAYIDPATGGMLLGGGCWLLPWIAAALLFFRVRIAGLLRAAAARPRATALAIGFPALAVAFHFLGDRAMTARGSDRHEKVLVLGLDGADPNVLRAMMDAGRLPNMKRVAERGAFHPLQIPNPAESPVVWAALATGRNPAENGVYDFIGRDPRTYLPMLSLMRGSGEGGAFEPAIRARAFWDLATEAGVPVSVLRWPMTFPPPKVGGRVVAGLGVPDLQGSLGRYTFFADLAPAAGDAAAERVRVITFQDGHASSQLDGPRVHGLTGPRTLTVPVAITLDREKRTATVTIDAATVTLSESEWSELVELTFKAGPLTRHRAITRLHLASLEPFGLLATSVELHPAAPATAFTHPPEHGGQLAREIGLFHTLGMPEDTKAYGDGRMSEAAFLDLCGAIEKERRAMLDYELARWERGVLAAVFDTLDRIQHMTEGADDPAQSAAGRYLVEFDTYLGTVLARAGEDVPVLLFSDHGFSEFRKSVDLHRWLVESGEMSLVPGGDGSGELYARVDWSRTSAYAVGFAGVYLNVSGREGKGIVPPAERARVAERIAQKLAALTDPETGAKVVHQVYPREEIYRGAFLEQAPDLVVGYRPGYRGSWQSAVGGIAERVITPNDKRWQRDHIVDASFVPGSLLTSFPIAASRPAAYDIAPTILSLLGVPVPEEMEGRPLHLPRTEAEAEARGAREARVR